MITMTAQEIASAVDGRLHGQGTAAAVTTDSRNVPAGSLFVPLVGTKADGHRFIDSALTAGAAGCLCARLPEQLLPGKFYIQTEDTLLALKALASSYRGRFEIPMVQITGSVGKTTTKEMIAAVLRQHGPALATHANFNNAIGVPLTLLGLAPEHWAAAVESGMDHFGEIRYAGEMIRPTVAVITNIGDVHLELLGSREGILQAKSEIFENLAPGGLVLLNGDDDLLNTLTPPFPTLRYGFGSGCQVRIDGVEDRGFDGVRCTVTGVRGSYRLEIPAAGSHMVYAAAVAAAVGEHLGLSEEEICAGAADYRAVGARLNLIPLSDGRRLIDDCYNANPQAMTAMLKVLARAEKTVAIMGDMGELGDQAVRIHTEMGTLARELGIGMVVAVGTHAKYMALGMAPAPNRWYPTVEAFLADPPQELLEPDTTIAVKASHFMGFDRISKALT